MRSPCDTAREQRGWHQPSRLALMLAFSLALLSLLGIAEALVAATSAETRSLADELRIAVRARVLEGSALRADSLVVEFSPFRLPNNAECASWTLDHDARPQDRRGVTRVHFEDPEGGRGAVLSLTWELRSWRRVAVARRVLQRGEVLSRDTWRWELRDVTRIHDGVEARGEDPLGRVCRRRVAEGAVLRHSLLSLPADIERHQRLTLRLEGQGLRVELPARSQEEARLGEELWVRIEDNGHRLRALLVEPRLAVVKEMP